MNDNAIIPTRASEEPTGLDLYRSCFDKKIKYWNLYN